MVYFQNPVSTNGVLVGKLRNSRWRPKWPSHATDFLTWPFFVQFLHVIYGFLGFKAWEIKWKCYFYIIWCIRKDKLPLCSRIDHHSMSQVHYHCYNFWFYPAFVSGVMCYHLFKWKKANCLSLFSNIPFGLRKGLNPLSATQVPMGKLCEFLIFYPILWTISSCNIWFQWNYYIHVECHKFSDFVIFSNV
jgi:hypothetical protein